MAIDIVSELRASALPGTHVGDCMNRAAAEIERLRNEVQELRDDLYRHGAESQQDCVTT